MRHYKRNGWYFKHNICEEGPTSKEIILEEISVFLSAELRELLEGFLLAHEESADEFEHTAGTEIIATFLSEQPSYWGYLTAAPVAEDQHSSSQPSGTIYQGFGRILGWLDSMHLVSYHEDTNCVYTLTCRTSGKSLLYAVLDSYTFWQAADVDKLPASFGLPQNTKVCNALLVNADQWSLGVWGLQGDFLHRDGCVAHLMSLMDIDMFELCGREKVIRAYYMNSNSADKRPFMRCVTDYEWESLSSVEDFLDDKTDYLSLLSSKQAVIVLEHPVLGKSGDVIVEKRYIYSDKKVDGAFMYPPCILECPLSEMHVVADCICKQGSKAEKCTVTEQQIEMFKKCLVGNGSDFLAKGCLTEQGLVIYECSLDWEC